jgi:hypothetical protein
MRPAMFGPSAQPRSGRYLSLPEREEIARGKSATSTSI